jgi:hypothetical protein
MQGDNAKPITIVRDSRGTMCRVADPPSSSQGSSLVPLERGTVLAADGSTFVLAHPVGVLTKTNRA